MRLGLIIVLVVVVSVIAWPAWGPGCSCHPYQANILTVTPHSDGSVTVYVDPSIITASIGGVLVKSSNNQIVDTVNMTTTNPFMLHALHGGDYYVNAGCWPYETKYITIIGTPVETKSLGALRSMFH